MPVSPPPCLLLTHSRGLCDPVWGGGTCRSGPLLQQQPGKLVWEWRLGPGSGAAVSRGQGDLLVIPETTLGGAAGLPCAWVQAPQDGRGALLALSLPGTGSGPLCRVSVSPARWAAVMDGQLRPAGPTCRVGGGVGWRAWGFYLFLRLSAPRTDGWAVSEGALHPVRQTRPGSPPRAQTWGRADLWARTPWGGRQPRGSVRTTEHTRSGKLTEVHQKAPGGIGMTGETDRT